MIYIYIYYIDRYIYIYYIDIYLHLRKDAFFVFQGKLFFHPRCIYFWLRAISQQLHVCQKCVHIYVFETVFYPTKRRFLPTKRRFFPTMFHFSVEMPSLPPYQIPWVPLRNNYYNSTMVGFPYVFQYVIIQFISILCWSMCTMWIYVYIYAHINMFMHMHMIEYVYMYIYMLYQYLYPHFRLDRPFQNPLPSTWSARSTSVARAATHS